jgi:hypothetical protein
MLKLEKWFTVLKNVNKFSKIKKEFLVKEKISFVNYYFTSHQTPENIKKYFIKIILRQNK